MPIQEYTQKLNHLGIVAEMCNEIGLVNIIDSLLPPGDKQIVSNGNIVKALILNMLDIGQHPLYLMPDFFEILPMERFFYPGLNSDSLNDSAIGRTLDRLHADHKLESTFMTVTSNALKTFKRFTSPLLHGDTTSMSVHGSYKDKKSENVIKITFGKSKDGRNDLKQFMISMVTNNRLPVFLSIISGNTSDKTHFRELVTNFGNQILEMFDTEKFFVFDSEFYTSKTLKTVDPSINWITRVPEKTKEAINLVESEDVEWIKSNQECYEYSYHTSNYGGVEDQQWLLVRSEKAYIREKNILLRNLAKIKETIEKKLWHLSNEIFETEEDAIKSVKKLEKKWKYHKIDSIIMKATLKKPKGGKGRPSKGEMMLRKYSPNVKFSLCQTKLERALRKKGRFILATNRKFEGDELLSNYKQQNNVERGFRFFKDPLFFVDGIFLKNEERIMSLGMILGLALLVYNLCELKIREAIELNDEVFTTSYRKPTNKPTIRYVFQVFEAIFIANFKYKNKIISEKITNFKPIHRQVLRLMGEHYLKMYEDKGENLYALLGKALGDKIK